MGREDAISFHVTRLKDCRLATVGFPRSRVVVDRRIKSGRRVSQEDVTALDQHRIAEWIGDAFAILSVRIGGLSQAEADLRLGFEAILRELRIPPLGIVARNAPVAFRRSTATRADLRYIIKALDSCLAIFQRYDRLLNASQRDIRRLVQDTREFAVMELASKSPVAV